MANKMSSNKDRVPSDVKSFLRSVLVSSNGVKESRVEKDYRDLAGGKLEWKKLGFKSLHEFLCAIPDVCHLQYNSKDKENRVYAVEMQGIYVSTHAKKNFKSLPKADESQISSNDKSAASLNGLASGRRVQVTDKDNLKITINERKSDGIELLPNKNGLYQIYVANLPKNITEGELKTIFGAFGNVREAQVVMSSRNKKYPSKKSAMCALTECKKNPPVLRGYAIDVGPPKCKNTSKIETCVNVALNFEQENGSTIMLPISSQIPSQSPPTSPSVPSPLSQTSPPRVTSAPSAFHVVKNEMQNQNFSAGDSVDDHSQVSKELLFAVNISAYNKNMTEFDLRKAFQNIGCIEQFEYHSMYSIARFKTQSEAIAAVRDVNGKFIDGSILLVSALKDQWPLVENKPKETKEPAVSSEEMSTPNPVLDEIPAKRSYSRESQFTRLYEVFNEAVTKCCVQSYSAWLDSLSAEFQIKVMEMIDPCTFWAHVADQPNAHLMYEDLVKRLEYLDISANSDPLRKGQLGAAIFSLDGKVYRCYCFDSSPDGKFLHVLYIDYGNTEWLPQDKVGHLPPEFFQLRPQGVLVRLSGIKFKSTEDSALDESVFMSAQAFLMNGKALQARRSSSTDLSKPLILVVELLQSEGEAIYGKFSSLPGIEVSPRPASQLPLFLISLPPTPDENNFLPLKDTLSPVKNKKLHYIWITNITSPTTFHFQLVQPDTRQAITDIQESLRQCNMQNKINIRNIKHGELVCYHRHGFEKSRVQLLYSFRPPVPGQVNVLHVDTGKEAMVPCTSFISLPLGAKKIYYQARPASLYNVPYEAVSQSSAALELIVQCKNKVLRANIAETNLDGSVIVELFDSEGKSINKTMLGMLDHNHVTTTCKDDRGTPVQNKVTPGQNRAAAGQNQAKPAENQSTYAPNQTKPPENWTVPSQNRALIEQKIVIPAQRPTTTSQNHTLPPQKWTMPAPGQAMPTHTQASSSPTQAKPTLHPAAASEPHIHGGNKTSKINTSNVSVPHVSINQSVITRETLPAQDRLCVNTSCDVTMPVTSQTLTSQQLNAGQAHSSPTGEVNGNVRQGVNTNEVNVIPLARQLNVSPSGGNQRLSSPTQTTIPTRVGPTSDSTQGPFVVTNLASAQSPYFVEPRASTTQNEVTPMAMKAEQTSKPDQKNISNSSKPTVLEQESPVGALINISPPRSKMQTAFGGTAVSNTRNQHSNVAKRRFDEEQPKKQVIPKDTKPAKYQTSPEKKSLLSKPGKIPVVRKGAGISAEGKSGRGGFNNGGLLSEKINREELKKRIVRQEEVLSRPAMEQRTQLKHLKTKEKLEIQVKIKKLENLMFSLENELKTLTVEKESLEKQLRQ